MSDFILSNVSQIFAISTNVCIFVDDFKAKDFLYRFNFAICACRNAFLLASGEVRSR